MKMKELSELAMDELLTKRRDLRQESLHLRLQQQSGQLEQPSRLRLLRRDLARIETELSQRAKNNSGEIDHGRARISHHRASTQAETGDSCRAQDAHRRGGFQQHEQDDHRADSHARATPEVR